MLKRLKVPHTLQWVVKLFLLYVLIFTLFRIAAYWLFHPSSNTEHGEQVSQYTFKNVLPAFINGLRYDVRWISIVLAPIVIASLVPKFSPFKSRVSKKIWAIYLVVISFLMLFFFGADFGHFSYVRTRLNASALNFYEDFAISVKMIWQSYPILWIVLGLGILVGLLSYFINRSYFTVEAHNSDKSKYDYKRRWYAIVIALMLFFIYGSSFRNPLTTNDSFRMNDDEFLGFLTLNPFQNFFTSLKFRNPGFEGNFVNEAKLTSHYQVVAEYLGVSNRTNGNYVRQVPANSTIKRPNIVLIMCESLSSYKTSMGGNALNTTPYLQSIANESIYFDRCFSASFGTARGLFGWLTGVPDVQLSKFSSRNEKALNQHTIINDFDGYKKHYFLGGSTAFNNFKGLINNIDGVTIHDENSFNKKGINVWGISDAELFLVANEQMKNEQQPFLSIIQTAQNHEPYSIDKNDTSFKSIAIKKEVLNANGFVSNPEYNAARYFDHAVAKFMEAAKKEAYFENTIFVFFGDHGVIGSAAQYPKVWTNQRLTEEHIPLFFYAPGRLKPQKRTEVVSQIDILPTTASLAGISYKNTSFGRNVLDSSKNGNFAFTIFHDAGKIGIVSDSFYFIHNYNTNEHQAFSMIDNRTIEDKETQKIATRYFPLAEGIYETSKWMLLNNKKISSK
jgi:phosphoglycerol transferase MdoB-like AlkP superfamily enzyme